MKLNKFDNESLCTSVVIPTNGDEVALCFSDELDVSENIIDIPEIYENKIIKFINDSDIWMKVVSYEFKNNFDFELEYKLITIYILSEPDEDNLVFGLAFWVSEDIEHGRGIKIQMFENEYKIIEWGLQEIASYPFGLY